MTTQTTSRKLTDKVITPSIMSQIERIDRSLLTPNEEFHLDLFLLSYHTGGVSLKDLAHLTWDKINGAKLDCQALTYPKVGSVQFAEEGQAVIDRYKDRSFGNYVLPIFGTRQRTAAQREGYVKRLADKVNVTLRKIEQIAGCGPITWQGARLAVIARMIEERWDCRDIYDFAGSLMFHVEEYYCNLPGAREKMREELERIFGRNTNLGRK